MLHRTLAVALFFCLSVAHAGEADTVPKPSILALFGLGVALLAVGFVRRRSERQRAPKD